MLQIQWKPLQASWKRTAGTNDEWRMPITVTHPLQSHTQALLSKAAAAMMMRMMLLKMIAMM